MAFMEDKSSQNFCLFVSHKMKIIKKFSFLNSHFMNRKVEVSPFNKHNKERSLRVKRVEILKFSG